MTTVYCSCGRRAMIRTSRTSRNPGRRFYSCPLKGAQCTGFISWVDSDMCDRSSNMIPGLLRSRNVLEYSIEELQASNNYLQASNNALKAKVNESEAETRKIKSYLILTWICVVFVVVAKFIL